MPSHRYRYRYLVYGLFFASGISGLMYEIVWLRMLSRMMGVTIYATATVVAAFMAGLSLGSFLLGRFIDRRPDPLRVYALLEVLIGVTALLIPVLFAVSLPLYQYIYHLSGENPFLVTLIRVMVSFLALLLPTTMMGGTLPILTSYLVRREGLFGRSFGLLYGINTFGAVVGVLLSGFVTIGALGETVTIWVGVAINLLVGTAAYVIYQKEDQIPEEIAAPALRPAAPPRKISPYADHLRRLVLITFAVSGFTSLAYEVIWTRQLILFLETSIYAFSGMLAVYLCGIAAGSLVMKNLVDRFARPLLVFGLLEVLVGLLSILNLHLFPILDGNYTLRLMGETGIIFTPANVTIILVFPLTFLFGLIFPVAGVCYVRDVEHTGASVGGLYSANTIGSILGSLAAGFILIPAWGSTNAVALLACLNVSLGVMLLWLGTERRIAAKIGYALLLPVLALLILQVKDQNPFLGTIERRIATLAAASSPAGKAPYEIFYNGEGIEGTVTAFSIGNNKHFWVNGIGMTVLCTETKLIAHLPLMFARDPKEFLVICFGMGTTVKSAALYPELNITAVELVPEAYQTFKYYHAGAEAILKRPNVHAVVNDGRNFLLLSPKKYDVITIDPAPPIWSAGTVNLYSLEFLELCQARLTPNGVMCLWFPGDTTKEEVTSLLKTFHQVFPRTLVYRGPRGWGFYFLGLMGDHADAAFQEKAVRAFQNPLIVKDLGEYDQRCVTPEQLDRLLLWDTAAVARVGREGVVITDDYPFTEFFLWRYLAGKNRPWQPEYAPQRHGGPGGTQSED